MAMLEMKANKFSINMVMIISIFLLVTPANAFFRLLCFNPLGFGRIDPIMSPGTVSTHLHHLHGPGNLAMDSLDADYLLSANCTSCSITVDKSGYWAPAMYFQHQNGSFELLSTSGSITIYYKTEKRVNFLDQNYTAFPKNFRMVAGNNDRRKWVGPWPVPEQSLWGPRDIAQEALASKALGFNCLNYVRGANEATFAFPYLRNKAFIDGRCRDGLRAEILFPSCWDGVNLDSADHKSHVAYPTLLQDGACPKSHPVYLPIMFFETIWDTQKFAGLAGQFVFSNGDPTGFGYHADFLAAWADGVLEQVMADPTCTDQDIFNRHTDGIQEHCPVFNNSLQSPYEASKCTLKVPEKLIEEKYLGPLSALPGNVKVTGQRHDPGSMPEDYETVPKVAGDTELVEDPHRTPPAPIATNSVSRPYTNTTASGTVSAPPATTSGPSAVPTTAEIRTTTTHISKGVWYEVVQIQYIVTVMNVVTTTVPATNTAKPIVKRHHHGHGHAHHGIA